MAMVDIAPHGGYRRDLRELGHDLRRSDISGVKNVIGAAQSSEGFGTEESMGVGYNANVNHKMALKRKKRPGPNRNQDATAALPQNCLTTSGFYEECVRL